MYDIQEKFVQKYSDEDEANRGKGPKNGSAEELRIKLRPAQGGSVLLMPDAILYSYSLGYVLMA